MNERSYEELKKLLELVIFTINTQSNYYTTEDHVVEDLESVLDDYNRLREQLDNIRDIIDER